MKYKYQRVRIDARIAVASQYFSLMEAQIQEAARIEAFALGAKYNSAIDGHEGEFSAMKAALEMEFSEDYGPFFRHSFLISLYSIVESCLEIVCARIASERGLELKPEQVKGDLDSAKSFLKHHAGVLMCRQKNWQALTDLRLIRNCLVHAGGVISKLGKEGDRERLWVLAKKETGLGLDARHAAIVEFNVDKRPIEARLIVKSLYCQNCLENIREFHDDLFKKLGWH